MSGLLGNIWPWLIGAGAVLLGLLGFSMKRAGKKEARLEDEVKGHEARVKVETEHADDTHQDRLDRLRRAGERDNP